MRYITLEDTVYLWFATNATSGSGDDGASAVYDVREGGAAAGAAPTLSGSATLLSHANYPAGAYEVAIAATAANGFAANKTYGVFCTLAVDSQNPTGFIGDFITDPVPANVVEVDGAGVDPSGAVDANVVEVLGTAPTEGAAGRLAGGITKFFNVASPTGTVNSLPDALAGTAGTGLALAEGQMNLKDNAITSAKIATDAITSTGLAASAVSEIQSGLSTLTQTQVSGGAYALNSASFAFNSGLDFTTAQKAATLARVTLTDTATNLTNLPAITANWLTATGIANDAITAAKIADGAIDNATLAVDTGLRTTRSSTLQSATAGAAVLDASASATNDLYAGLWLKIIANTGVGQVRLITAYNGTSKSATITPNWATTPDNTSQFAILPAGAIVWNASWDAEVESEATDALNAYDPPTHLELQTAIASGDDATLTAIAALSIPTADQNAAALLDLAAGVETGLTLRQALRLLVAAEAAKLSGAATTTITIRNFGDSKNRITATVDADGNRSAITYDLT